MVVGETGTWGGRCVCVGVGDQDAEVLRDEGEGIETALLELNRP